MGVQIAAEQLEILITFMENHPGLSIDNTSFIKQDNKKCTLWKKLKDMLNSNKRGPSKSIYQWSECWRGYKSRIRRKFLKRKSEIEKKGYSLINLSPLEKRIWKLAKYRAKKIKSSSSNADDELESLVFPEDMPSVDQDQESSYVPDSLNFTDLMQKVNPRKSLRNKIKITEAHSVGTDEATMQIKEEPLSESESISNEEYFYPTVTLTTQADANNEVLPDVLSEFESCGAEKNNSSTVLNMSKSAENAQSCISSVSSTTNSSSTRSLRKSKKRKQPIKEKIDGVYNKKIPSVLERIATALEIQAAESKEQTKLMHKILNVLTKR